MPRNNISDLSATNTENTDIGGADVSENCAPGGINDAIRNMGGMLARAFAEADPTHKVTAIKSGKVIVPDTSDTLQLGTTSPTTLSHNNTTPATTVEVGTTTTPATFQIDVHDSTAKRTVLAVATDAGVTVGSADAAAPAVTIEGVAQFNGVAKPSLETTTTWDASAKQVCSVTASGATTVTLSNVSTLPVGTPLTLIVTDAASASLTLAGATFKYASGTAPSLNGTAGETMIVSMIVIGTSTIAVASVTVS